MGFHTLSILFPQHLSHWTGTARSAGLTLACLISARWGQVWGADAVHLTVGTGWNYTQGDVEMYIIIGSNEANKNVMQEGKETLYREIISPAVNQLR